MPNLLLLMGCPGSGKTYFAKNIIDIHNYTYISRDEIRFSMVKENEEYFSKEKEVFAEFTAQISAALGRGENVIADATHLNRTSRKKLINAVTGYTKLEIIHVRRGLQVALDQNENRKGTRSYVPRSVIRRMWNCIEDPSKDEGFDFIGIAEINPINNDWCIADGGNLT